MLIPLSHRLIAHRGWQRRYPENSLPGIEAAIATGAKHVEIDIQLTADRQAVLCHDHDLQRLCGVAAEINDLSLSALQGFSAHEPERLGERFRGTPPATLAACAELLERHADVTLYVEVKRHSLRRFGGEALLQATLPILRRLETHCCLISFDLAILEQAQGAGWARVAPVLSGLEQLDDPLLGRLNPELVFCDSDLPGLAGRLPAIPWPVAVYEIDRAADARRWFELGAALVESFAVGELIDALGERRDG